MYGQPPTVSSSLIPMGTPPKGSETSAAAAAARAASASRWLKALSSEASMAASDASSASVGEMVPARKASTSEQASPSQGWSVTGHDATGIGPGAHRADRACCRRSGRRAGLA